MESMYSLCFYGGLALAIIFLIASVVLFIVLKIPKVVGDLTGHNAKKSMDEMRHNKVSSSEVSKKEQAKYYNQNTGKIKVKESVSPEVRKANRDDTTDLLDEKKKKPKWNDTSGELGASGELDGRTYNPDVTEVLGSGGSRDTEATDVLRDDEATDVLRDGDETELLRDDEATDVLRTDDQIGDDEATDVLRTDDQIGDDEATDVLRADDEATDVLRADDGDDEATDVLRADYTPPADEEATDVLRADTVEHIKPHNSTVIYNIVITHTDETI
jgi:hypothetical protein